MSVLPQFTVAAEVLLDGVGLHTGKTGRLRITPSERGRIEFLCNGSRIPADLDAVVTTERCTTLGDGKCAVATVEHLLAAMSAMGVSSAEVAVEGPEIPALDGSAQGFVNALRSTGTRLLSTQRAVLRLKAPVFLEVGHSSLVALPLDRFRVTVAVRFGHPMVGSQVADIIVEPDTFERDIAPARTFGFLAELPDLDRAGLARGGSVDNALVFLDATTSSPLRFPDEPARHKALDVIGDLALLGAVPLAHIVAVRPSHRLNVEFARLLRQHGEVSDSTT
jgi:UDP-3-O-[3-hydroxymyristoyl] N-acetylglucosamine deacetylase